MARRRYQDPKPERRGNWWTVRIWKDKFQNGVRTRYQQRVKLCDANQNQRQAAKLASELIRPLNQGLISIGGGVNFVQYIENNYTTGTLPTLASTTQEAYQAAVRNHLIPTLGRLSSADISKPLLKNLFAGLAQEVNYPTLIKVRDSLSSILRSAVEDELLVKNPQSGHTHGGQVAVEFKRCSLAAARLITPYIRGWFQKGDAQLYVNRGIGTITFPIRIGARPEITVFELERGA